MASTSFFDKPNALGWMNYYANQAADTQPTMSTFGGVTAAPIPTAPGTTPPIAGQNIWGDIMSQMPPGMFDDNNDKDGFSKWMKWSVMRDLYENHPEVIKQRGQIYGNIMNEMADKANERAMQGHLFAGFLGLGDKFRAAEREKLAYLPETLQIAARGSGMSSPFLSRQYV